ncbi:TonB-dependent receptor [Bacteroides sp. UBA939]|uniref:TonB-dependent receptor n=1 Tax=Bacteroides sp. UBA939 TaxID=1946092 RepID=UPI0025C60196|nr:TonB-dependent receptor [Bacteroides sp. UBA939]
MKVWLFFVVCSIAQTFAVNSYSQTTTLTLNLNDVSVEEVLNQIENQSEYHFLYNKALVDVARKVNISFKNKKITEILDEVFKSRNVSYVITNRQIVLTQINNNQGVQQSRSVKGQVVDSDGEPIIGANIKQKGTGNGVISDIDGNFAISVPPGADIEISYIGYITQMTRITADKDFYLISLKEDAQSLDEVVVVGYGVQKKKLLTGATVQVTGDNIQKLSTTNIYSALQSQTPGVNITQTSGMPGEDFKVVIRGIGTNGRYSPLIVIDGVAGASLTSLNTADVESVDVLKDAASAAIYGSRAANGVILVTTKQGKIGKAQISYDGYYGIQTIGKKAELLNAKQYMEIMNLVEEADEIKTSDFAKLMPKQYQLIQSGKWNGTNWLDEATNENAPIQSHAINITAGSESIKLASGLSFVSQEGIIGKPATPNYEQYNFRINTEVLLYKKGKREIWKVGENLTYSYRTNNGVAISNQNYNDVRNLLVASPLLPAYNDQGQLYVYDDMIADEWNVDRSMTNPIATLQLARSNNINKRYNLQGNLYTELIPIENLKIRSSFGYKMTTSSSRSYTPVYKIADKSENVTDDIRQSMSNGWNWTWDNTVSYKVRIDKHTIDLLAGQSVEKWGYGENIQGKNSYSLFPGSFKHAWLQNAQGISTEETTLEGSPWDGGGIASFFGRISYNYNETYMLDAVLRADGSSNFARGHRWGYFPSVSAGWVITNEQFMESTRNWLDFFKMRISWGQNGNSDIRPFQYLATVAFDENNGYFFNNDKKNLVTGGYPDIMPNPFVTWETSEQINIGFDARFLNSRLGVNFDWYRKTTKDWLLRAPALSSYGTGAPYINGGDIRNTGFEVVMNWNDNIGKLRYGINLNLSKNKNEVTHIANSEKIIHGQDNVLSQNTAELYRAQVGYPIGYFYGYKTDGIFQNTAEIEAMNGAVLQANPVPGDVRFVDYNKDGKVNLDDKTIIGDPNPDFTLGFGLNLEYKGLDFSLTANGAFGHQIAKSYRAYANNNLDNYTTDVYNYWTGEGSTNKYPRLTSGRHPNWKEISDRLLEDGDYLKIKNITVGYDFKKLFPQMPLQQARLYLTAQNLFTITGYSGMDPEVGYGGDDAWASGIDLGFYPSPRTFIIGVNLKF